MEQDRALTNLGPEDNLEVVQEQSNTPLKQPGKRIVGSRATAEGATVTQNDTSDSSGALQTPRPARRIPRTLNQVPPEILHDADINEAIAHLPANYNFEIHKTIHRIRSSGAKNIALQFPEGLLLFAPLISDILTRFCPGSDTLIMGDVTYGACCIDDYTARAIGCDLLVHYGHSCLVPVDTTKGIKTLYVFVTIGIDIEHLVATIGKNFQPGKKMALVGTIQFNSALHTIVPHLRTMGFEAILPRSAPLSAGEILGCTAPTLTATSSADKTSKSPPPPRKESAASSSSSSSPPADADMILYVGDGRFHLESILIASPSLRAHTYRYDPYTRRLTHETYEHEEMHSLRRTAIRTARHALSLARRPRVSSPTNPSASTPEPVTWGIILGTLGRQGNPHTLALIKAHLSRQGVPHVTLLLSEIAPQKLARMSADVAVWVQIACPRLSIDWGYAFERPLLSPFEACVALGVREGGGWAGGVGVGLDADDAGEGVEDVDVDVDAGAPPPVYPMDFYGKEGLGRTTADDVPDLTQGMEIEVR